MDIRIYRAEGSLLVQLSGRIVLDVCDRLKSTIVPRISKEVTQVSLDLSKVEFIDSAGLGLLVGMKVSSNKNRARLALIAPSKNVNEILMVSKLDSIFDIVTGRDAETLRTTLAQPEFLIEGEGAPAEKPAAAAPKGPSFQAPPPMATASSAPPKPQGAAAGNKERIEQLCKNAIDYMRQGDYDRAAEAYLGALEIDPNYLTAYNNLAIVYEKKPQWLDKAIAAWEKVLALSEAAGDAKHSERAQKHLQALQRS